MSLPLESCLGYDSALGHVHYLCPLRKDPRASVRFFAVYFYRALKAQLDHMAGPLQEEAPSF